jgi:hypothetical protein
MEFYSKNIIMVDHFSKAMFALRKKQVIYHGKGLICNKVVHSSRREKEGVAPPFRVPSPSPSPDTEPLRSATVQYRGADVQRI